MSEIKTSDDLIREIMPGLGWALHSGSNEGFEVWHSANKPEERKVLVHDFSYTEEDGTKWRGSMTLLIEEIEAHIEDDDDWEEE